MRKNNIFLKEFIIRNKNDILNFKKKLSDYSKIIKNIDLLVTISNTEITLNIDNLITPDFKIPVLSYQKEAVYKKALLALWQNQFFSGTLMFRYINDLISGKINFSETSDMYPNKFKIYYNVSEMGKLNFKFPLKYISLAEGVK